MANEQYEFSEEQNRIFILLANVMKYAALLFIFLGVIIGIFCGFTILNNPIRGITYFIMIIMAVAFGVWTNSVSYSLKQIVETTGKDVDILMEAFKALKQVYILQFIWLLIMTLLLLAVLVMSAFPCYRFF